ncbi:MAG: hypothetical protein L0227_00095 [Chloroflexi bacterium]|nr:hypothetical protein [Chloroflexota bacterium]
MARRLHRPFIHGIALVALVASACGGSASETPGPSDGPVPSASAAVSEEPGATGPGETSSTDGAAAFGSATTALDALDSYRYEVEVQESLVTGGTTSTSHTQLAGVVHNRPEESSLLEFRQLDGQGVLTAGTSVLVIGDRAWLAQVTSADQALAWQVITAAQVEVFIQGFRTFRPAQAFGTNFGSYAVGFQESGTETKNGVECRHFEGIDALGELIAPVAGVTGTWTADAWIAVDGGYLVHSELHGEGTSSGDAATYDVVVDISDIDSAEALEAPG